MSRRTTIHGAVALAALAVLATPSTALAAPETTDAIQLSTEHTGGFVSETTLPVIMSIHASDEDPMAPAVVVPGDTLEGTVSVKNVGPSDGVLTAYVVRADGTGPQAKDTDAWFTGDLQIRTNTEDGEQTGSILDWGETNAEQIGADGLTGVQIAQVDLARGDTTDIDLATVFPEEAVSANSAGPSAKPGGIPNDYAAGTRTASFDVHLVLAGDTNTGGARASTGGMAQGMALVSAGVIGAGALALIAATAFLRNRKEHQ